MSLSVAGVWQVDVWEQTVWEDGVWREGPPAVDALINLIAMTNITTSATLAQAIITNTSYKAGIVTAITKRSDLL